MSHTVAVKVNTTNQEILTKAVQAFGGQVIGEGEHQLYQSSGVKGFGFTLPNWTYPLVLTKDGELKYDNYEGRWGKTSDLDAIKGLYAVQQHRMTAASLGFLCTDLPNGGLEIHTPGGGVITSNAKGDLDTENFIGGACKEAVAPFLANVGGAASEQLKEAYFCQEASIQQQSGE